MFYKAVITSKGLALDAKIKAGQTTAAFTRVKLGDGTYDGQEELKEATDLKNTRNEFGISSIKVIDENTVRIRIVTNNSNLNSGYYISELALFATDPDEGEILYSISLGVPEKMDYQPSEAEMFNATATIDILTSISDAETANIQTGTGAAASAEDLAELETRMEGIETPEFDASGTVEGITGKTTLLASFVTRMPLVKFMRNVVAGFKLVLYAGQVVNNCVTDNAGLPLSAAQGKVLMDLYTVLNTNLINMSRTNAINGDIATFADNAPLNTFLRRRYEITNGTASGAPDAQDGYVEIHKTVSNDWIVIYAITNRGTVYTRAKTEGVWGAWTNCNDKLGVSIQRLEYRWDNQNPKLIVTDPNGYSAYVSLTKYQG